VTKFGPQFCVCLYIFINGFERGKLEHRVYLKTDKMDPEMLHLWNVRFITYWDLYILCESVNMELIWLHQRDVCVPSRTQCTYQLIACMSNTGDIAVHAKRYICRIAKELYFTAAICFHAFGNENVQRSVFILTFRSSAQCLFSYLQFMST